MTDTAGSLTLLETVGGVLAVKTFTQKKGKIEVTPYGKARKFKATTIEINPGGRWLRKLQHEPHKFVVLGQPENWQPGEIKRRISTERDGVDPTLIDVPRAFMPIDIDHLPFESLGRMDDGETLAIEVLDHLGIPKVGCVWQFTNSHAIFNKRRIRLWLELSRPMTCAQMREYAAQRWGDLVVDVDGKEKKFVDPVVYRTAQPIYTGAPIFKGMDDPVRARMGVIEGTVFKVQAPRVAASRAHTPEDDNVQKLIDADLYIRRYKPGQHCIVCPWEDEHTDGEARDDDTFYFEPHYNGHDIPAFKCHHGTHVDSKHWSDVAQKLGITQTFKPVQEDDDEEEREFVYVHRTEQFFDPRDGAMLSIKAYDSMHGLKSKRGKPHERFLTSDKTSKADAIEFLPGEPRIVTRGNVRVLNTYIDRRLRPDFSIDASPFVEHLAWLIPDESSREWFSDWIAHVYQNPGIKITWAPILFGPPGTGKTTVLNCLAECIGRQYVSEPSQSEIEDKFNEWCFGKVFVKIEELMSGDRYHVSEKLKPIIANPTISVRPMHHAGFSVKNVANVAASTNHMQALPIERGDRRYMLIECRDAMADERKPHMRELWEWIEATGYAGVAAWLAQRDLSQFRAASEAPHTELKRLVQEASQTDFERAIDLCEVFDKEEVISSSAVSLYLENNENPIAPKRFGLIARRRRWSSLEGEGARTRKAGRKVTLWSGTAHLNGIRAVVRMEPAKRDQFLTNLENRICNASSAPFSPVRLVPKNDDDV